MASLETIVWNLDLKVVETEFTLVGVNPALDEFKDVAAQLRKQAETLAHEHGRTLAGSKPGDAPGPATK